MKVKIWSDLMCPFCYIAKNNFEDALKQLSFGHKVQVEWKSYQLDPQLDDVSGDKTFGQYLIERKGFSEQKANQFFQQIIDMGQKSDVNFDFDKTFVANTFSAHQLLHLAKKHQKDNEMEEILFQAFFENGQNIADIEVLVSLAEQAGLDKDEARNAIDLAQFDYDVNQDLMEARNLGISGVPFFVIDDKYGVSGAQPAEAFIEVLTQSHNESDLSVVGSDGKACSI